MIAAPSEVLTLAQMVTSTKGLITFVSKVASGEPTTINACHLQLPKRHQVVTMQENVRTKIAVVSRPSAETTTSLLGQTTSVEEEHSLTSALMTLDTKGKNASRRSPAATAVTATSWRSSTHAHHLHRRHVSRLFTRIPMALPRLPTRALPLLQKLVLKLGL